MEDWGFTVWGRVHVSAGSVGHRTLDLPPIG